MQTPLEIARESLARHAEEMGAPYTAKLHREGRYDKEGLTPSAERAAAMACEQAEREIGELAALAAECLFRADQDRKHEGTAGTDDARYFAEDQLRKHPLVAKQLSFYQEKPDAA